HAGRGETFERGAREVDVLGMRGEGGLLDVNQGRAGRLEAPQLRGERVGDAERAPLEALVVRVLRGERREGQRTADRRLQLAPCRALREGEVAHERRAVGLDRAGDDRLAEVRVVVIEPLERSALRV